MDLKNLYRRIVEISVKNELSHLGSCLTAAPIIDRIYKLMGPHDKFVLSSGHAGLALYVVLEKKYGIDAELLLARHGIHPGRDVQNKIHVSTGSLGLGILVAVGLALGDKNKHVHVLVSDGECAEGSVWEALRFIHEQNIENITVHFNINGWSAYKPVDRQKLTQQLNGFGQNNIYYTEFSHTLQWPHPLAAHYEKAQPHMLKWMDR